MSNLVVGATWDDAGGMMIKKEPVITAVYSFANGMTIVFDQHGKQMPDYGGPTSEAVPKIRAAGFTGDIPYGEYRPRNE